MRLIFGPEEPAIDALRQLRCQGDVGRITVLVAWARVTGVAYFLNVLGTDSAKVRIVVGMSGAGTSAEALSFLRAHCGSVHLFHKHHRQTFHPKVYCFEGVGSPPDTARLLVGSSNLTGGGLFANFEASFKVALAPAQSEEDREAWRSVVKAYDLLVASPFAEAIASDDRIQVLLEERYLSTEKALRRRSSGDGKRAAKGSTRRGKPEAPPPPIILPELPVPTRIFVDPAAAAKPTPSTAAPAAVSSGVSSVTEASAFVADGTFFVRTLTPNDIAKAVDEQVGTFEPDLGVMARAMLPGFWGWPDEFRTVVHTKPREEWAARAIVFSSAQPTGVELQFMIWSRTARAKTTTDPRPHAAEFRFRPGPKPAFQKALPADFSVTSLVVIERLAKGEAHDFRLKIIAEGEAEYDGYHRYLTTVRPGHRFGYGPDDPEE